MTEKSQVTNDGTTTCHSERSRGISRRNLRLSSRDPSTSLRSAQDDGIHVLISAPAIRASSFLRPSSFVIRHFQ